MIRKHDIPLIPLKKPKKVFNADGTENKKGKVTHVIRATIIMDQHKKDETIWVTDIGEEEFIIGLTWLRQWNPNIDWITGKMIISLQIRAKITKSQEIAQPLKMNQRKNLKINSLAHSMNSNHYSMRKRVIVFRKLDPTIILLN